MYYSNDGLKQASTADKAAKVTKLPKRNLLTCTKARSQSYVVFLSGLFLDRNAMNKQVSLDTHT